MKHNSKKRTQYLNDNTWKFVLKRRDISVGMNQIQVKYEFSTNHNVFSD